MIKLARSLRPRLPTSPPSQFSRSAARRRRQPSAVCPESAVPGWLLAYSFAFFILSSVLLTTALYLNWCAIAISIFFFVVLISAPVAVGAATRNLFVLRANLIVTMIIAFCYVFIILLMINLTVIFVVLGSRKDMNMFLEERIPGYKHETFVITLFIWWTVVVTGVLDTCLRYYLINKSIRVIKAENPTAPV